jgi:hypothetical protein
LRWQLRGLAVFWPHLTWFGLVEEVGELLTAVLLQRIPQWTRLSERWCWILELLKRAWRRWLVAGRRPNRRLSLTNHL